MSTRPVEIVMANIDPVASVTRTDMAQATMGQAQVSISREAARQLSELAEAQGITRKEAVCLIKCKRCAITCV